MSQLSNDAAQEVIQAALDRPRPPAWRRLVPAWLRGMVWLDEATEYDAFLSYSWTADGDLAPLVQSVIQQFLCPWYKVRRKRVFRDLASLPAGSDLYAELYARLDRSRYLIVMASPDAARSAGMEKEARHWFETRGLRDILVLVTSAPPARDKATWEEIRQELLPPTLREKLSIEPLWVSLTKHRAEILRARHESGGREILIEDLKQLLLTFYPDREWGDLRGEERTQRTRALFLVVGVAFALLGLATASLGLWREASRQAVVAAQRGKEAEDFGQQAASEKRIAEAGHLAALAQSTADDDALKALDLAVQAAATYESPESGRALARVVEGPMVRHVLHQEGPVRRVVYLGGGRRIATASGNDVKIWDADTGNPISVLRGPSKVIDVDFSSDGARLVTADDGGGVRAWVAAGSDARVMQGAPDCSSSDDGGKSVIKVVVSADGTRVAAATASGCGSLWDAHDGAQLATFEICGGLSSTVAFSADSQLLVTWGTGCVVASVLRASDGHEVATLGEDFTIEEVNNFQGSGRPRYLTDVAFYPDSHRVVTAVSGSERRVSIWQARTGRLIRSISTDTALVSPSHDGKLLATATGGALTLWDSEGKAAIGSVDVSGEISRAGFTLDDRFVFALTRDDTIRLWDATGEAMESWKQGNKTPLASIHMGPTAGLLGDVAVSPRGSHIAMGRKDGTTRIYDVANSHPIAALASIDGDRDLIATSADGARLVGVSYKGVLHGWDTRSWEPVPVPTSTVTSQADEHGQRVPERLTFTEDGRRLVALGGPQTAAVWDASTGQEVLALGRTVAGDWLALSSNARLLSRPPAAEGEAVWNLGTGAKIAALPDERRNHGTPDFSPDGRELLYCLSDGTVRFFDLETAESREYFSHDCFNAIYLPDSSRVIIASRESTSVVNRWSGGTLSILDARGPGWLSPTGRRGSWSPFSPDGDRVVISYENTFHLFEVDTGRELTAFGEPDAVKFARFSSDGRRLLTSDSEARTISVWNTRDGQLVKRLTGHTGPIEDAAISSAGERVASVADDDTARLWNATTGDLLATFTVQAPISVRFVADDKQIVVGTRDEGAVYAGTVQELRRHAEQLRPVDTGP